MSTVIVWLRRDLRLADHPALAAAAGQFERLVALYIHAPQERTPAAGAASQWWLHHSLAALRRDLVQLGSELCLDMGASAERLRSWAEACQAEAVYANAFPEPAAQQQETAAHALLAELGIPFTLFPDGLLTDPFTIRNQKGSPYRAFTPFWRKAQAELAPRRALPAPGALPPKPSTAPDSLPLEALGLLPQIRWDTKLAEHWEPGEAAARRRLSAFLDRPVGHYQQERDRPAHAGTSRLSPHLSFGEISIPAVWQAVSNVADGRPESREGAQAFLDELGWREFAYHLLAQDPDNRLRMVVGSFLAKNLRLPWQLGEAHFRDTLVDWDPANNSTGWQWVTGCGADAAPYFRIFNPIRQGQRFDPHGAYVRHWVPELAEMPPNHIHAPWQAPAAIRERAGVTLGAGYPAPVIDPGESRQEALAAFQSLR